MAVHVAIVTEPYERLILAGAKTVEARLTKRPIPPFGCIAPGQRIYFKRSAGPFFAIAVADQIWMSENLDAAGVEKLRRQFNRQIHGDAAYWQSHLDCRYATLIWLRAVQPCSLRPRYKPQNMRAWYALDDAADPMIAAAPPADRDGAFEVALTAASIRHRHVRLGRQIAQFPAICCGGKTKRQQGESIVLHLHGGEPIITDIVAQQKMIRWRGWGPWFERNGLAAGDRLRFEPRGERAFSVRPVYSRKRSPATEQS